MVVTDFIWFDGVSKGLRPDDTHQNTAWIMSYDIDEVDKLMLSELYHYLYLAHTELIKYQARTKIILHGFRDR